MYEPVPKPEEITKPDPVIVKGSDPGNKFAGILVEVTTKSPVHDPTDGVGTTVFDCVAFVEIVSVTSAAHVICACIFVFPSIKIASISVNNFPILVHARSVSGILESHVCVVLHAVVGSD